MAESTPHILVQADPDLTEYLWRKSAVKPFVLAPACNASKLQDERTAEGDPYVHRFPAMDVIGHILKGKPNQDAYDRLEEVLADARKHFGLENERLRISVVGSHTSISDEMIAGYKHEGGDVDYLIEQEFLPGMRRHRQLAGLLGAALHELSQVETPWLAPAYSSLCPNTDPPDGDLVRLAAQARSDLDVLAFEYGEHTIPLSRPALPLIYIREHELQPWKPLGIVDARAPYWTTDSLIGQFRQACRSQPNLEGVLVKVVGARTSQYCPVDAPVVGERTFERAAGTNISAILLDKQFGIVRPFGLTARLSPPVYRV